MHGGQVQQLYLTYRPASRATEAGGIEFLESKRLQIRAQARQAGNRFLGSLTGLQIRTLSL
jgi:hypothetical protein